MKKFPIYNEWVQTLMDYNDELIGIIDEYRLTKQTQENHGSMKKNNLIDFDDNVQQSNQQTTKTSSILPMNYEETIEQNVRFYISRIIFSLPV